MACTVQYIHHTYMCYLGCIYYHRRSGNFDAMIKYVYYNACRALVLLRTSYYPLHNNSVSIYIKKH